MEKIKEQAKTKYPLTSYILFFFCFSLLGWVWEVLYSYYKMGYTANRGFLTGPWLPIYGSGAILVLLLLRRFTHNVFLTFTLTMIVCSAVEYATSLYLEYVQGRRWWNYSGYRFHLSGRICLEGALFFGFGGCLFIYFLAPLFQNILVRISNFSKIIICILLVCIFSVDFIYSQFNPNTGRGVSSTKIEKTRHLVMPGKD